MVAYKDTCMHESAVTAHIMHRGFFVYSQASNRIVPLIIEENFLRTEQGLKSAALTSSTDR